MKEAINHVKREHILETADRHFKAQGYDKTQVSAIARDAGVSIGTIYSLFENKEGLLSAHINNQMEHAYNDLLSLMDGVSDPVEKLVIMTRHKFEVIGEQNSNFKELLNKNPMFLVQTSLGEGCPMKRIYELTETVIAEIARTTPLKNNDYTQMAYNFKALSNGYVERWAAEEGYEFSDKADEVVSYFLDGIKR